MGKGLNGKRIAIGGSRKTEEISTLIEKQGGTAVIRSLQGTVYLAEEQIEPDVRRFVKEKADWAIFTTGIGMETLRSVSEKIGLKEEFLLAIQQAKIGCRGYKTFAALKKLGMTPSASDEDGTTRGLIRSLERFEFQGQKVMIQLHGEKAPVLTDFLEGKGAQVFPILPYQHIPPERETVDKLCRELMNHEIDAVCFTTAIQVRSLFDYAREKGIANEIKQVFEERVLAAAVGKVTAEAIRDEGIMRLLAPEIERMGAMIIELSRYYESLNS
ncbi:uroporphyrinogen-III synthase [Bacillus sp. YC2]|uniref:uroporphyrinogen-III synthase n=1 Tax=Bacillus sp. YC2 TaxID=2861287 RepID=UPI001CA6891D|nr:uroporphyrinogen-III synthase [Bacillus sp. YC2]MBY8913775.1 uroporphyrinogen-III synthase [Bacillus sp. YC2]